LMGLGLLLLNLINISQYYITIYRNTEQDQSLLHQFRGESVSGTILCNDVQTPQPNIYYIVLDGYERADKMKEYYHYDNAPFIQGLKDRGFYVASESRSNYINTKYSIPSELNLTYISNLPNDVLKRVSIVGKYNFLEDFLNSKEYKSVFFESNYMGATEESVVELGVNTNTSDQFNLNELNQFDILFLKTSMGRLLVESYLSDVKQTEQVFNLAVDNNFEIHRNNIYQIFYNLPAYAGQKKYFVFAHILSPHPPFVWGPNGEKVQFTGDYTLFGDNKKREKVIGLYTGQSEYIGKITIDAIDQILQKSKTPPIIILQSDHGNDAYLDNVNPTKEGIDIRSANLSAFYFPDSDYGKLSPTLTNVNTFRIVLNKYFCTNFSILPDKIYKEPSPDAFMELNYLNLNHLNSLSMPIINNP
jgi:hypothetical protein